MSGPRKYSLNSCRGSACDLGLERVQLLLDGGAGERGLLGGDGALLHGVPFALGGGIELAAAQNIQPCLKGGIGGNESLDGGVDGGRKPSMLTQPT